MGSSISAILAILYMNQVEKQALDVVNNHVGFYSRYIDDICLLGRNATEASHIHNVFNQIDSHIKFEIELPKKSNTLELLDLAIKINTHGELYFDFFTKAAKKPVFVNFKSALPTRSKMHYIHNERTRIVNRCSNTNNTKKHLENFDNILRLNDYPDSFINKNNIQNRNKHKRKMKKKIVSDSASYFNIPFVNDNINKKIRNFFFKEDLNVRLSHRTSSLRSALKKNFSTKQACNKKGCTLDSGICFRKNVVYKIKCNKCQKHYIGSTVRNLHTRIHEHFNHNNSSVFKHMQTCKSKDMIVSVIDKENRKGNLRIREAYHIQKSKPEINSKEESRIDLILF